MKIDKLQSYKMLVDMQGYALIEWYPHTDTAFFHGNWRKIFRGSVPTEKFFKTLLTSGQIHEEDHKVLQYIADCVLSYEPSFFRKKKYREIEFRLQYENRPCWCKSTVIFTFDKKKESTKVLFFIKIIDDEKNRQKHLLEKAETDALTGLYNKAATKALIREYLEKEPDKNKPIAFFLLDLDGFKGINDSFGHLFGDGVLVDIAMTIRNFFRASDIIGRFGGDEFIIFLKDIGQHDNILKKCPQLLENIRRSYKCQDDLLKLSASIGIVFSSNHNLSFEDLFHKADLALYAAKKSGKDQFCVYHSRLTSLEHHPLQNVVMQVQPIQENIPRYAFRLLKDSKNLPATIDMLLKLIGSTYDLDRIYLLPHGTESLPSGLLYEWLSQETFRLMPEILQAKIAMRLHAKVFQKNKYGVMATGNVGDRSGTDPLVSFMHFRIYDRQTCVADIIFDYCRGLRRWTDAETETFSLIGSILGVFLSKKQLGDKLSRASGPEFRQIVDTLPQYLYVVDASDHSLLFLNKPLQKQLRINPRGEKCYAILHKRETPCTECPLHNNPLSPNSPDARPIDWPGAKSAYRLLF